MLTYSPIAAASGTLAFAFSYVNSAGTAKTGTVSIPYTRRALGSETRSVPDAYFLRLALMTFGSCAMRDRTLDSCGSPEIEMPMRMCATLSRLSVTVVIA